MLNIVIYFLLILSLVFNITFIICSYSKDLYTTCNYEMNEYSQNLQNLQEQQYIKRRKSQLKKEIANRDVRTLYIDELEEIENYGDDFLNEVLNSTY